MDALLVVATIGVVWIPVHAYLSKTDLADLRQWVVWVTSQRGELDGSKKQFVEEEMQKLRRWNYQTGRAPKRTDGTKRLQRLIRTTSFGQSFVHFIIFST